MLKDTATSFEKEPRLVTIDMEDGLRTKMIRAMHVHDDRVEILLVRNGHGVHTVGGKSYATGPSDILIYNADAVHDECADSVEGMDIFSCSIGNVKLKGLAENTVIPPGTCPVITGGRFYHEIEAILVLLYTSVMDETQVTAEMRAHLLRTLLLLVQKAAQNASVFPQRKGIELGHYIQGYIDAHYLEDLSLSSIADALGMNQYYLSHIFKSTVGYSPMQYVIRRRVGEAQSYLLMTDKSVTEIALLVGYNSTSNFHRAFIKMVGISPQKYRETWMRRDLPHKP